MVDGTKHKMFNISVIFIVSSSNILKKNLHRAFQVQSSFLKVQRPQDWYLDMEE